MNKYKLPDLPYSYDALQPYISKQTMHFHHDFHHQGYVTKLNAILSKCDSSIENYSLIEIMQNLDKIPYELRQSVKNNGGGHLNHTMFWNIMASPSENKNDVAKYQIYKKIIESFKSFDVFHEQFTSSASQLFGSGWVWLAFDNAKNKLEIIKTQGHETPIMDHKFPVLVIDVWEHAYYLDYQNRRVEFINNFEKIINWEKVNDYFLKAKNKKYV